MKKIIFLFFSLPFICTCTKNTDADDTNNKKNTMFFPDNSPTGLWETITMKELGWNETAVPALKTFLSDKNTKSFMILVNGRIAMEEYFNGHTASDTWEWNSAGKTLVTATTGIAQQEGLLKIDEKVSKYLGNWTAMAQEKEQLITVRHLLTMTSGINDEKELVIKPNLSYLADAGTRWSYHNVFQRLMDVAAAASNQDFDSFFSSKLRNKIGMDGFWNNGILFKLYHSNTRSMARFGILALNMGKWKNETIVDEKFFLESVTTSQNINPSYGYLWWLNGKTKYMIPGSQTVYNSTLIPNAPSEMYAAMGALDQRIYIIPSSKMVIVRMGNAAEPKNPSFAVSGFDNQLWEKINAVIKK